MQPELHLPAARILHFIWYISPALGQFPIHWVASGAHLMHSQPRGPGVFLGVRTWLLVLDPLQLSAPPFASHWLMGFRALLTHEPEIISLMFKSMVGWGCVFLTGGPPSVVFCFRHLWCWTKGGPFPGLVPLGPCGYSVLSTWSEEQPSKCPSTHILCTVASSTC